MAHIELSRGADAIVVAPATADFIAKLAHGLADDLLSTMCVARALPAAGRARDERARCGRTRPRSATSRRCAPTASTILGPAAGDQACGEVGMGRMLEPAEILARRSQSFFPPKRARRRRVLVTGGPDFEEPIDTVRGITNPSSGKMGYAVARAAARSRRRRDADQRAHGAGDAAARGAHRYVRTARGDVQRGEDARARRRLLHRVAAVADYTRRRSRSTQKLKKSGNGRWTLKLKHNQDILAYVAALPNAAVLRRLRRREREPRRVRAEPSARRRRSR